MGGAGSRDMKVQSNDKARKLQKKPAKTEKAQTNNASGSIRHESQCSCRRIPDSPGRQRRYGYTSPYNEDHMEQRATLRAWVSSLVINHKKLSDVKIALKSATCWATYMWNVVLTQYHADPNKTLTACAWKHRGRLHFELMIQLMAMTRTKWEKGTDKWPMNLDTPVQVLENPIITPY